MYLGKILSRKNSLGKFAVEICDENSYTKFVVEIVWGNLLWMLEKCFSWVKKILFWSIVNRILIWVAKYIFFFFGILRTAKETPKNSLWHLKGKRYATQKNIDIFYKSIFFEIFPQVFQCWLHFVCSPTSWEKRHPENWQKHQTAWNINQHVNFQMIATSNKNVNEFVSNFNVFILFLVSNNISYSYFWISTQLFSISNSTFSSSIIV